MAALIFIAGLIWGSLSAQFLVQTITSLIIAFVYLAALASAKVPRAMNAAGSAVSLVQAIIFMALFLGGNWLAGSYMDFASLNAPSVASFISFLATLIYTGRQMSGKILLAKLSAGDKWFLQAAMNRPREERVELAMKYSATPTMETLYPPSPARAVPPIGEG